MYTVLSDQYCLASQRDSSLAWVEGRVQTQAALFIPSQSRGYVCMCVCVCVCVCVCAYMSMSLFGYLTCTRVQLDLAQVMSSSVFRLDSARISRYQCCHLWAAIVWVVHIIALSNGSSIYM